MKINPWVKVGAGLAVGIRLGQYAMAVVETAADRWLHKTADKLEAKTETENETEEVTE